MAQLRHCLGLVWGGSSQQQPAADSIISIRNSSWTAWAAGAFLLPWQGLSFSAGISRRFLRTHRPSSFACRYVFLLNSRKSSLPTCRRVVPVHAEALVLRHHTPSFFAGIIVLSSRIEALFLFHRRPSFFASRGLLSSPSDGFYPRHQEPSFFVCSSSPSSPHRSTQLPWNGVGG